MNPDNGWRDFGIMFAYIIVNIMGAILIYWLARVPKGAKGRSQEKAGESDGATVARAPEVEISDLSSESEVEAEQMSELEKQRPLESEKPISWESEKPTPQESEKPTPQKSEKPTPQDSEKPTPQDSDNFMTQQVAKEKEMGDGFVTPLEEPPQAHFAVTKPREEF